MVESIFEQRVAELSQQYQTRPSHNEIAEELSELAAIRDQLKEVLECLVQRPKESHLSPEFPTLGAFVHRINTLVIERDDYQRRSP